MKVFQSKKPSGPLTLEQISTIADGLVNNTAAMTRQADYIKAEQAYGIVEDESNKYSRLTDTKRSPKYWEQTDLDIDFGVPINLYHQLIEAQKTVVGSGRNLRVPARSTEAIDVTYASKLEKAGYHLWREWGTRRLWMLMGFYCALYGSAVLVLVADKERGLPWLQIRAPKGFYATPSMDDESTLSNALFVQTTKGYIVNAEYGTEYGDDEDLDIMDWYDKDQRVRYIKQDLTVLLQVSNPIKKVCVWVVQGIVMPGVFGDSTIKRAIPVHDELMRLYAADAKVLWLQINAPTQIKDPINVPQGFKWGDNATLTMGPQGDVSKAKFDIDNQLLFQRIMDMKDNLDKVSDFINIARGQMTGSIITGKAVTNLSDPWQQRIQGRLEVIDPTIAKMMQAAFLLWNKIGKKPKQYKPGQSPQPAMAGPLPAAQSPAATVAVPGQPAPPPAAPPAPGPANVYGNTPNAPFSIYFDPKVDIDPEWVEVIVWVDSGAFIDKQAYSIEQIQKLRGTPQAMSLQRFLQLDPDCDDVDGELKRIKQEQDEEIQRQMQMQMQMQAAQAPPTAAPGPAGPAGAEVPPEGGPPPAGPEAPPFGGETGAPLTPGAPGAAPAGGTAESVQALAQMFQSIPGLTGNVWITGDALDGLEQAETLTVFLSDGNDKAKITQFMKANIPELWGEVTFHIGTPNEPNILVVNMGRPNPNLSVQGPSVEQNAAMIQGGGPLGI